MDSRGRNIVGLGVEEGTWNFNVKFTCLPVDLILVAGYEIIMWVFEKPICKFGTFVTSVNLISMGAINTLVVDLTLIVLSLIFGAFYARSVFKNQKTSVKIFPLFIIWAAGLWCLLNWIGHIVAIFYVNLQPMLSGSFTYTFDFYSVMFLGVVFMLLSLLQLEILKKMSQLHQSQYKFLKQVSVLIILFSLPIIPLNPIGSLPVISSVVILITVAVTKRSWGLVTKRDDHTINSPQTT